MSNFNLGDMVAVYGIFNKPYEEKRLVARVVEVVSDVSLKVSIADGVYAEVHPKQCRKLRKRREAWLIVNEAGYISKKHTFRTKEDAETLVSINPGYKAVRFIEAKKQ
jgi:hypothetical protein